MTPRGRPLSEERSDHILGAVLELLHEQGYDQLRMQDVADHAGVGLATIYRRWPTKRDLVRASLECDQAAEKFVTTDDARADVRAFFERMARDVSGGVQTFLGFVSICRTDPEAAEIFRDTALRRMQDYLRSRIAAVLGDDDPELDLRAAAGPAILIYQAAVCGQPFDVEEMADRLTSLVFAPLPVDAR